MKEQYESHDFALQRISFLFFSREEERKHVHVQSPDGEAKYWLEPKVELASNHKYSNSHLKEIEATIRKHSDDFIKKWERQALLMCLNAERIEPYSKEKAIEIWRRYYADE